MNPMNPMNIARRARLIHLPPGDHRIGGLILAAFLVLSPSWAATKTWRMGSDNLWSTAGNWNPTGVPALSDNIRFANDGATDASAALGGVATSTADPSFLGRINSLAVMNIQGFHNLHLAKPLEIRGASASDVAFLADDGQSAILFAGSGQADGAGDIVYASISGAELTVVNTNASLSVMQASVTSGAHRAVLDMSGLNSFTCVLSNILVGHDFGVPITRPTGTLFLALTNSITARLISIADAYQNAGAISLFHLGQVNTLNVDRIRIALHKCLGTMDFNPGVISPSATFRNAAGTGRQTSWEIGDEFEPNTSLGYFTSSQSTGIIDLTGGIVDALVDRIVLGRGQTNALTRTGDGNGTLTFGAGTINVNHLELGIQMSDGGSAGRGIVNVNNDDGAHPASLIVNSNVTMAVQLPGNTDATGSTAQVNLNGGRMAVAGDFLDGAGLSTININSGGILDLMPSGDSVRGNVAVDILKLEDGSIINFGTLSVSNINLGGSTAEFVLEPGQTLFPIAADTVGTLAINGPLRLRGTVEMDLRKSGASRTADQIVATGAIDFGGTLRVRLSGTPFAVGDKFKLFGAPLFANVFTTLSLPSPGPGLAWTNKLAIDGTLEVFASGEPTSPPILGFKRTSAGIELSWPTTYTTFSLRAQTNSAGVGLSKNWSPIPGVVGNQVTLPINAVHGSVFFQLFQP